MPDHEPRERDTSIPGAFFPNPPASDEEREWISLRDAASRWARHCGENEDEKFQELISATWRGEFEPAGYPQLFTFEVPQVYKGICSRNIAKSNIRGKYRSIILDEVVYLIDLGGGIAPFLAEKVKYSEKTIVFHGVRWIDEFGELWTETVDENGQCISMPNQNRDKKRLGRREMLEWLAINDEVEKPFCVGASDEMYLAYFAALSKRRWSQYAEDVRTNLFARLHINKHDLNQWAQARALPFPVLRLPAERPVIEQPRTRRRSSRAQIRQLVGNYLGQNPGSAATQTGAERYVRHQLPGASRQAIRDAYRRLATPEQMKPGRRGGNAGVSGASVR